MTSGFLIWLANKTLIKFYLVPFLFLVILFLPQSVWATEANIISGFIFQDLDLNSQFNLYEQKLANWQVDLYFKGSLIKRTFSDQSGYYSFDNLNFGNYQVEVVVPNTWAAVSPSQQSIELKTAENIKIVFAVYQVIREDIIPGPIMLISNFSMGNVSSTRITINWFTNHLATSQIVFGKNSIKDNQTLLADKNFGYSSSTPVNFAVATYHSLNLTDLKPETTYYYRLVSLANPKQWRGAKRVFSQEFSFTTDKLKQDLITPPLSTPEVKLTPQASLNKNTTGLVLAKDFSEQKELMDLTTNFIEPLTATAASNITATPPLQETKNFLNQTTSNQLTTSTNCSTLIWFLLFLNVITIFLVRAKNKASKKIISQRLWWFISIFIIVPIILGYPQCWLTVWQLFILILTMIYLFISKKQDKSLPPPMISKSAFDFSQNLSPINEIKTTNNHLEQPTLSLPSSLLEEQKNLTSTEDSKEKPL